MTKTNNDNKPFKEKHWLPRSLEHSSWSTNNMCRRHKAKTGQRQNVNVLLLPYDS